MNALFDSSQALLNILLVARDDMCLNEVGNGINVYIQLINTVSDDVVNSQNILGS